MVDVLDRLQPRRMTAIPSDLFELSDDHLDVVQPLIVPAEYGEHDFPAPLARLADPRLLLTWVALARPDWMTYVKPAIAADWRARGIDLHARALANMRAADDGLTWTHEKTDDSGRLVWVAMMHEDGLGSSRLLCHDELAAAFPEGYIVSLPDRSFGLALSAAASPDERRAFEAMVRECFDGATTPMLSDLLPPEALLHHAD